MDLKVICWNIEHFTGNGQGRRRDRVTRVAHYLATEAPDIFAILEVVGGTVFATFTASLPNYTFFVTEGPQSQEILIGIKQGVNAFVTQKNEFKRNNPGLRPGALVTVTGPTGIHLPILFNHLKSLPSPEGFGLRDAMFEKAFGLKRSIDDAAAALGQDTRFIIAGDLNTMGMTLKDSDQDIAADQEIARLDRRFRRYGMQRLDKTHPYTFNNGSTSSYPPADLDHVFATENLDFVDHSGAQVKVAGWAEAADQAGIDDWVASFSDHAPLVFTVRDI